MGGLMLLGLEHSKIQSYFIPSLGPAPKWCHFLEGLTEEMEEKKNTAVYDDYKFVTKQELSVLGLDHLIGTKLLRASMHGYFIDLRLYKKAKAIADPFAFDNYRKQKIDEALKSQEISRIAIKKKLPKVNANLADRLLDQIGGQVGDANVLDEEKIESDMSPTERKKIKKDRAREKEAKSILYDERFKA